jgi:hypothetical protein
MMIASLAHYDNFIAAAAYVTHTWLRPVSSIRRRKGSLAPNNSWIRISIAYGFRKVLTPAPRGIPSYGLGQTLRVNGL